MDYGLPMKAVRGARPNCPARAHDTENAHRRYGCRCWKACAERSITAERYRAKWAGLPPPRGVHQTPEHVVRCLVYRLDPGCRPNRFERWEACRRLALQGWLARAIAEHLGYHPNMVWRILERLTLSEQRVREEAIERLKDSA